MESWLLPPPCSGSKALNPSQFPAHLVFIKVAFICAGFRACSISYYLHHYNSVLLNCGWRKARLVLKTNEILLYCYTEREIAERILKPGFGGLESDGLYYEDVRACVCLKAQGAVAEAAKSSPQWGDSTEGWVRTTPRCWPTLSQARSLQGLSSHNEFKWLILEIHFK